MKQHGLKQEQPLQPKIKPSYQSLIQENNFDSPIIFVAGDRSDSKIFAYELALKCDLAYVSYFPLEIEERGYYQTAIILDNQPNLAKLVHVESINSLDKAKLEVILKEILIKIKFNLHVYKTQNKVLFSQNDNDFNDLQLLVQCELGLIGKIINIMNDGGERK